MASTSDNHASSSSSPPQRQKPSPSRRVILSMKRSLSQSVPKKRPPESEYSKNGMHSTFEETNATSPPQQFREADPVSYRPTIQQIAMGLHTSRTPHLRPLTSSSYTFSQQHSAPHSSNLYEHRHHKTTSLILPPTPTPTPTRSSMKKPSPSATSSTGSPAISPPFSTASATSTTLASLTPSSSRSPRLFAGFRSRMARFLPRSASLPSSLSSPLSSPRSSSQTKKAVRFITDSEVVDGD